MASRGRRSVFKQGEYVMLKQEIVKDYTDCELKLVIILPAGSVGQVLNPDQSCFGDDRPMVPVRFLECENYPNIYLHGDDLGPGHYIAPQDLMPCAVPDIVNESFKEYTPATEQEMLSFLFS